MIYFSVRQYFRSTRIKEQEIQISQGGKAMESNYFPPTEKEAKEAGVTSSERRNAGFPSRLRQLRNKKGESQATLAKELMVTKSTISLYEI